jgi:hypothetical protein
VEPFWVEDKASYSMATVCHQDLYTRAEVMIRTDATDRSFIIPDLRVEEDPAAVIEMLGNKYGFQLQKAHGHHFHPAVPWT